MSRKLKFLFSGIVVVILLPGILLLGSVIYVEIQGNFYTITPGEAYRSAQPGAKKLERYLKQYGIKSIINLRGKNPDKAWYQEELKVSKDSGAALYSVALSSKHPPDEKELKELIRIFNNAPRPVLIHCKRGADRTGLVAAMWKVFVDKEPKREAKKQLSPFYFHFRIGKTASLDRFFDAWEP